MGSSARQTVPTPVGDSVVGVVTLLTRFPVKSTAGETLSAATLDHRGLVHDRHWGVYTSDGGIASGKTSRRFRKVAGLMDWRSTMSATAGDHGALLHSPDGNTYRVDSPAATEALSQALGQPLTLRPETTVPHHDDCGIHLVTTSSVREVAQLVGNRVDVRRSRANIVLGTDGTGFIEDAWSGAELAIGPEVVLGLGPGMPRCVMVDQPQVDVPADAPMLKALGRAHDVLLGLQAHVIRTGTISLGDEARLTVG